MLNHLALSFLCSALLIAGLFLLCRISAIEYIRLVLGKFFHFAGIGRKKSGSVRRRELLHEKRTPTRLERWLSSLLDYYKESRKILHDAGRDDLHPIMIASMAILFGIGLAAGTLCNNMLLSLVLAIGLCGLPMAYVHDSNLRHARAFAQDMKAAAGVVTNTYIQNENIVEAFESNLSIVNLPFSDVFAEFVAEAKYIDTNIPRAIESMKRKIDSSLFREWCDVFIQCYDNREMKQVLPLIVDKMEDLISAQSEQATITSEKSSEYKTIFIINALNLPLMFFLKRTWFFDFVTNPVGKAAIAVAAGLTLASIYYAIYARKPVEYE